jgi:hypothetical protein
LGDGSKTTFSKIVALQPGTETLIFLALLFAVPLNLDEVCQHTFQYRSLKHSPSIVFENKASSDNERVTDQLFLSIWLTRHARRERLRYFEKALHSFPFSQREQPQSAVSILAVSTTEPPLLERPMNGPIELDTVTQVLREYKGEDVALIVDGWWDLWQFDADWKLRPVRVSLCCFGPDFDNGTDRSEQAQEDLRIDFGVDSHFLPQPQIPGSAKLIESNIKSLLRVVHELEQILPIESRRLETESGENFADRLSRVLSAADDIQ